MINSDTTSSIVFPINLTNVIKNSDFSIPTTQSDNIPNYSNSSFMVGITNYNGKQYGHLLNYGELIQDIDETITLGKYYVKINIFSVENNPVSYGLALVCYNETINEPIQATNITKSGEIIYVFDINSIPTKFINSKIRIDIFNNTNKKLLIEYLYLITPNSKIITTSSNIPTINTLPTVPNKQISITASNETNKITLLYLLFIILLIILIILIIIFKKIVLF
jgi:hypothetical protein